VEHQNSVKSTTGARERKLCMKSGRMKDFRHPVINFEKGKRGSDLKSNKKGVELGQPWRKANRSLVTNERSEGR